MTNQETAVVAEGLPVFREAILRLLRDDLRVSRVDSVADLDAALDLIGAKRPDLAVIDRELPGRDPFEVLTLARKSSPSTRVVLTGFQFSDDDIRRASGAGACGCVLKSDTIQELRALVNGLRSGRVVFSRRLRERLALRGGRSSAEGETAGRSEILTKRETRVLTCIAQGLSLKETAALLGLSPKTVDSHRTSIMAKLDLHDRVLLTRYAIREGLVSV